MAIFSRLLGTHQVGMDKAVVGEEDPTENKTGIEVTAAIFFDGTGNNRNNTAQRLITEHNENNPDNPITQLDGIPRTGSFEKYGKEKDRKNKKGKAKDSYAAGYSNVSIIESINRDRKLSDRKISLYIEGIGTNDDGKDPLIGGGLGTGDTGIVKRVELGVARIADSILGILVKNYSTLLNFRA